ncbi:glycoside hydrolase family 88 protein [Aquimarina algicola]|uniref:Glycoside hydrolase family 88 protein n=1 Tax=Aquimarina algicola TaxID=2589995 RepID=A0A504JRX7_9FLAO|nr:glycoside hydrolase family 88 protein [Aquimarina algicola]TPN89140.1 hypothetical protein FHK87_02645 [Aquimarina algicola]
MIYFLLTLLFIISFILLITLGLDTLLFARNVFRRYKIGRWTDRAIWLKQVQTINLQWLKKTPTVKLTDNECYVIKDMIKGHYRSSTIQSWQEGGALLGALSTSNADQNIKNFISSKIDAQTGKWKENPQYVDSGLLGYTVLKTNAEIKTIEPALDQIIQLIEESKGEDGTVFYRKGIPNIRFVDTIGFICPFLTAYGIQFQKEEYIDLAILQIKAYVEKAFLPNKYIPAHAYDLKKDMPLGLYGWGRGLGWFILGIVDTYNELPKDHTAKEYLKSLILNTANDLMPFQKENGSFAAMLAVDASRHDSSITTLGGWLLLNAYMITSDEKYLEATQKCISSLMQATRRNGIIDFCQGDTKGIGLYAQTFDLMPFVQGLTIRLVTRFDNLTTH